MSRQRLLTEEAELWIGTWNVKTLNKYERETGKFEEGDGKTENECTRNQWSKVARKEWLVLRRVQNQCGWREGGGQIREGKNIMNNAP